MRLWLEIERSPETGRYVQGETLDELRANLKEGVGMLREDEEPLREEG